MFEKILTSLCACILLAAFLPLLAQAEEKPASIRQPEYTVEGKITFIELDGTVIVRPVQTRGGPDRIVYIKEYTKITRNHKAAQQADLKPGDMVWVSVGPMRDALEMKATGP